MGTLSHVRRGGLSGSYVSELSASPDLDGSVEKIRTAARRLDQIKADLVAVNQPAELIVLAAQLRAAIESLNGDATHNADVLVEAVTTGEGGEYVDDAQVKTLHELTALQRSAR